METHGGTNRVSLKVTAADIPRGFGERVMTLKPTNPEGSTLNTAANSATA